MVQGIMTTEVNAAAPGAATAGVFGDATIRRVESLTLVLGGVGVAYAGWRWGWRGALGLAIGVGLSWINFRLLRSTIQDFGRGAAAVKPLAIGEKVEPPRVPFGSYFKFFGRFVLQLVGVYVILTRTSLPVVSVFAGLFAPSVAVVAALLYELLLSLVRQGTRRES